jgi:hypothetical protein
MGRARTRVMVRVSPTVPDWPRAEAMKATFSAFTDGPATLACLNRPNQAWPDGEGGVYIADSSNNVIRRVVADGTISLYAGLPPPAGATFAGDGGPVSAARFNNPTGITIDSVTGYMLGWRRRAVCVRV